MCLIISSFVAGWSTCQHIKDSTQHACGFLQPLLIPSHHSESWYLDFIMDLPLSHGCNAVFTYVDRLIKLFRLVPCFLGGS